MRILVAEDDPVLLRLLEKSLQKWDHEVVQAVDGQAALEAWQNDDAIQMVVLDWMMPRMDGLEVCRTIKADTAAPTYIMMLTAKTQKNDIIQALGAGADCYITKPFNVTEFRAHICLAERIISTEIKLRQQSGELNEAREHIKTLQSTLPLCVICRKVRDDPGYWNDVEEYLARYAEADLADAVCPNCSGVAAGNRRVSEQPHPS